ncbi:MAG: hypothetical protein WDM71_11000 [Ferruginibacter sp.]
MKNYTLKSATVLLFFIFFVNKLQAQQLDSLLNVLDSKYPQEKVYLQFDRPYYNAGETIWFKAYITSDNLPSTISKTFYAELLDAKGNILQRKTMPVIESGASSSFDLPDSLHSSLLYVRAYTSWMLNFDSSFIYLKPIHIITTATTKKNPVAVSYSLHFFPEGGDLIEGINSRLAFKANNQNGMPFNVNGNITDDKGNIISAFSSTHDGMGYFSFTPAHGKKYSAIWKDKKGIQHETPLPDAKAVGIALRIDNIGNMINYTLSRPDSVDDAFTAYYVIAQMQQQPVYSARINMSRKTIITATIPTDSLPDGIMQLTVFNADKIPVAERIVFINHGIYYFNTDLHAVEKNLGKRARNVLQIDIGGTLKTNLSVSVTDADLNTATDNEENIFSSLLLTNDIKGYVYNPAYYFSSDDDSVKKQLDLVMMTNGWRRFKWKNLLAEQWPTIKYQPENYLSIKGKTFGLSPSLLKGKEVNVILKTKSAGMQMFTAPVDKDGSFKINDLYFFDTAHAYYQFNNDKDKTFTSASSFSFFSCFVQVPLQPMSLLNSIYFPSTPDSNTLIK